MNLQFYVEKLKFSKEFKNFIKENPDSYSCSGFFTIDKEGKDNQRHIDFYNPKNKQMFSFKMDSGKADIELVPTEMNIPKTPEKLSLDIDFDFNEIESLILKEMEKNEVKAKIQKILVSLQNLEEKIFLVCTVFISGFGLLKVIIDLKQMRVTEFEKKSFFDIVKRVK